MNKCELIDSLSNNCKLTKAQCKKVLDEEYKLLCYCLKRGEFVNIKNFGKFCLKTQKERVVKNNLTNTNFLLPNKMIASFKISKKLKDIVS